MIGANVYGSKMLRIIILVLFGIGLCGCTASPTMRMDPCCISSKCVNTCKSIQPCFIPIDCNLIQEMERCCSCDYYCVGARDVLEIGVWQHPEFNLPFGQEFKMDQLSLEQNINGISGALNPPASPSGYLVEADGNIYFPLVGYVNVDGKTVEQIRCELSCLLKKYVRHPQINVRVAGFRSKKIYIMGEVVKPGLQPITDSPLSITDAINLVGGMDPNTADPSHIYVIRGNCACPNVYWLNARSPNALLLAENFHLQNHDIVFVSSTDIARFNRVVNQLLPSIQTLWYTYAVTQHR